jgi:hypothetical protein
VEALVGGLRIASRSCRWSPRRLLAAWLALACTIILTSCGGLIGGGGSSNVTAPDMTPQLTLPGPPPKRKQLPPNGESSKSAAQIFTDALAAVSSVHSLVVTATGTVGAETVRTRVAESSATSKAVSYQLGSETEQIIQLGNVLYERANAAYWVAHGLSRLVGLANRWFETSLTAEPSVVPYFELMEPPVLMRCLAGATDELARDGTTTIAGKPALLLQQTAGLSRGAYGFVAVASTGTPYMLEIRSARGTGAGLPTGPGSASVCSGGASASGASAGGTAASGAPSTSIITLSQFNSVHQIDAPANAIRIVKPSVSV